MEIRIAPPQVTWAESWFGFEWSPEGLKGIVLAVLARIAGIMAGRALAGKFLAHYFMGSGKPMTLPRWAEEEVKWQWDHHWDTYQLTSHDCEEMKYCPDDVPVYELKAKSRQLWTTVGSIVVWDGGDAMYYLDVYNWHTTASQWNIRIEWPCLPFSIKIRGMDQEWLDTAVGKPFITAGKIPFDMKGTEPPPGGD